MMPNPNCAICGGACRKPIPPTGAMHSYLPDDGGTPELVRLTDVLASASLPLGPQLFTAMLLFAAMGALTRLRLWPLSREEFMQEAGRAYDRALKARGP